MPFTLGIIPARGGSKGIPRKNLFPLAEVPLIKYTFEAAKASCMLSDVIVSTDCIEIAKFSRENGMKIPFMRPAELSSDTALAVPTMQHAVMSYEKATNVTVDIIVMLQPTAPLRTSDDIDCGVKKLIDADADGLISVVEVDNFHPYKMKTIVGEFLYDYVDTGLENPPRQSLPPVYIVNGALYITKRDVLMTLNSFKGSKCVPYIMPSRLSVNIDSYADFATAEFYIKNSNFN